MKSTASHILTLAGHVIVAASVFTIIAATILAGLRGQP